MLLVAGYVTGLNVSQSRCGVSGHAGPHGPTFVSCEGYMVLIEHGYERSCRAMCLTC